MPREPMPIGNVLCKGQCRDNCVFSTCAKYPPSNKGLPPANFSIEQLDQFNLDDKIPAFNEVGIDLPQPKGLKYAEQERPQPPPPPPKPNALWQEEILLPPPSPPTQLSPPPQHLTPLQEQTQYQLQHQQQSQQQNQLYAQAQADMYNVVPVTLMQPQPQSFHAYNSPNIHMQEQPFNAYNTTVTNRPVTKPQMGMGPSGLNQYTGFPQTRAIQCPHCNNMFPLETHIPEPNEPPVADCCNATAMPSDGGLCCQLATCPANEGQYQNMMQFSQFRSAQSLQRQLTQVPSLSYHKPGLISNSLNLPANTRALTKNLNTISTCSFPFQGHAVCQCSQQENNKSLRKKASHRRKEIYHECLNQTGSMSDIDINSTIDSSELFHDYLRNLALTSQKLLDNYENALKRKNISKTAVPKSSSRSLHPVKAETKYDQQNIRLEPIKITVPLNLNFSQ